MVQAIINIQEETNKILNIVKAKHDLKDKSQAIDLVVNQYGRSLLEPQLRPAYKVQLQTISKSKHLSRKQFEEAL